MVKRASSMLAKSETNLYAKVSFAHFPKKKMGFLNPGAKGKIDQNSFWLVSYHRFPRSKKKYPKCSLSRTSFELLDSMVMQYMGNFMDHLKKDCVSVLYQLLETMHIPSLITN